MESPSLRLRPQEWMRIDLLKAVHAALLTLLPREAVLEFWARHPFILFRGPLPSRAFFRYLWESKSSTVPPTYFWPVLADLEAFLPEKGIRADRFFQLLNHGPAGGPPLDPERILAVLPAIEGGVPAGDLRDWLLAGLPDLARSWFPGCRMESIGTDPGTSAPRARHRSRLFLFQPLARATECAVPDFRLFPGKLILALPRLFGCASFDQLDLAAEMRGPADCLGGPPDEGWNWKGDLLRHGSRRMGRIEVFDQAIDAWPSASALREALGGLRYLPVLLMERDFVPPGSKEARLRAGRIYGAPAFLAHIGYAANRRWERIAALLLKKPADRAGAQPPWEVAERLHRELLESLEPSPAEPGATGP